MRVKSKRDMEESIVLFETAKLAKEKGFNIQTVNFYNTDKKPRLTTACDYMTDRDAISNWNNGQGSYPTLSKDVSCSAPTQSLLQKWLREVHEIDIFVVASLIGKSKHRYSYYILTNQTDIDSDGCEAKTYEQALEIGLQEALKLIETTTP